MAISNKDILIVIPARFKSKRFPGKPLAKINGIEMIKRTYSRTLLCNHDKNHILVATDSKAIFSFCKNNEIKVAMTSKNCLTGTDRVAEIASKTNYKYYINLQGDEPVFDINDLNKILKITKSDKKIIINGYSEINDLEQLNSLSIPKVIFSKNKELLYMSRRPIPSFALKKKTRGFTESKAFRQICVYVYPRKQLLKFKQSKKTHFENAEDIEILRFLEMGIKVKMTELSGRSISVDNPNDIKKVEQFLKRNL